MKKYLIAVDLQKDFVDGALGSEQAQAIVPAAAEKIRGFSGEIFLTLDTHNEDYLQSSEGKKLPVPHCIKDTDGWKLDGNIEAAIQGKNFKFVEKPTFGSVKLPAIIAESANGEDISIEIIGLCTDICVVSNAMILKANFPDAEITVDAACCAGVTDELHNAALDTMGSCQINVINRRN